MRVPLNAEVGTCTRQVLSELPCGVWLSPKCLITAPLHLCLSFPSRSGRLGFYLRDFWSPYALFSHFLPLPSPPLAPLCTPGAAKSSHEPFTPASTSGSCPPCGVPAAHPNTKFPRPSLPPLLASRLPQHSLVSQGTMRLCHNNNVLSSQALPRCTLG